MPTGYKYGGVALKRNGKAAKDANCCCGGRNCCPILVNFPELEIDVSIVDQFGTPRTENFTVTGGPLGGWTYDSASAGDDAGGITGEYATEVYFDCIEGADGGSGVFVLRIVLANSSPCLSDVSQVQEHPFPCCPIEQEYDFAGEALGDCIQSISATVRTPADVPCPEANAA